MKKITKRYSIRVNGLQVMEYNGIQKTLRVFNDLSFALCKNDNIRIYDRVTNTYINTK